MAASVLPYAIQNEEAVGKGHPTKPDVVNRALRALLSACGLLPDATFRGLMPVFNVAAHGAKGDGVTDDSVFVASAVAAAKAAGGGRVFFPQPTASYHLASADVLVTDCTNVHFEGEGGRTPITLAGVGRVGFHLGGSNTGVRFRRLKITGSGVVSDAHAGIATGTAPPTGTITTDFIVDDCEIGNVTKGVQIDVATAGDSSNGRFLNNYIHDIVGTASGSGYGIACTMAGILVSGNVFDKCQRHSCYLSLCTQFRVLGNQFRRHRNGVADGSILAALEVARANSGTVVGNTFDTCEDLAMSIEPSEDPSHTDSHSIVVHDNVFADSTLTDISIGTTVTPVKRLAGVVVSGNTFRRPAVDTNPGQSIRLRNGKRIRIQGNDFLCDSNYTVQYSPIYLAAEQGAAETDDVDIRDNSMLASASGGGTCSLVEVGAALCAGTQRIMIGPNTVTLGGTGSGAFVFFDAAVTNPNLSHTQLDLTRDLAYGPTVNTGLDVLTRGKLTVTNGTAFTFADPTQRCRGRHITYDILNSSGGAMGAVTFGASFKLAGAFVAPANGKRRLYRFYDDGTNMVEESRSAADI